MARDNVYNNYIRKRLGINITPKVAYIIIT